MKPIEFIHFDGDSSPNTAAIEVYEALGKDIKILGASGEYEVLSYYISGGVMTLDIQIKGEG